LSSLSLSAARGSTALLVVAGVLWGTGGLSGALLGAAGGIDAVPVAAYRLLVGGLVAVVAVIATGRFRRLPWSRLLAAGGLLALFQAAYQVAVVLISVSLATLLTIGCVPVFVTAAAAVRDRAVPERRALVAIAVSLVGLALLCGAPTEGNLVGGVAMSLLAGAGFAALTLIGGGSAADRASLIAAGLLVGGVLLAPVALTQGMAVPLTGEVLLLTAYLGVVPTAVAYGAYFLGLRHAHPTAAALATMLEPLTATLLAVAWHGERLGLAGFLGAALICTALAAFYLRR
jgi:drug/metabolite transporter, DME family